MLRTIYGFDDLGRKVPTGSYDDGLSAVGGRIFYIDPDSDETVKFYDAQGTELQSVAVGDTPTYYKVTSAGVSGKDKYYIYNQNTGTGAWGYNEIATSVTSTSFGDGKTNTASILNVTDTSSYASTSLWAWLVTQNNNELGGCDDWYIGTREELKKLKSYLDANADGTTIINFFLSQDVYAAAESSSFSTTHADSYETSGTWGYSSKTHSEYLCVAIRSF